MGRPADNRILGLPERLAPDWQAGFLRAFEDRLNHYRWLKLFMDICVRCGACAGKCPVFVGTGDPMNTPAARVELARKVYEKYLTSWGRLPWRLGITGDPEEKTLFEWYIYFNQCLTCRRCALFCPLGIDPAEIALAARSVLAAVGLSSRCAGEMAANQIKFGNCLGLKPEVWQENCDFLEGEVFEETGVAVRFPVDAPDCEVLLLPASADVFVHLETMIGYAKMFHAAGVSWTTTSSAAAENYGLFIGYRHMKQINRGVIEAARRLRPKRIVWGESGHGWRVGRNLTNTLNGPLTGLDFLQDKQPQHICGFTLSLLQKGAFDGKLDPEANQDYLVSYHDPCQAARSTGLIHSPRALIRAAVPYFKEMPAETIGEMTLCCGAGAGLLGDESSALRLAAGEPRARALSVTGADYLAAACSDCKSALPAVLRRHLGREIKVGGVMELFGRALTPYLKSIGRPEVWKEGGGTL